MERITFVLKTTNSISEYTINTEHRGKNKVSSLSRKQANFLNKLWYCRNTMGKNPYMFLDIFDDTNETCQLGPTFLWHKPFSVEINLKWNLSIL
jgi:hypothetical protein